MDKGTEGKIARSLYEIVADHITQVIGEFGVDVRKPLQWGELTDGKKAFWCKEAERLGYRKLPEGKPPLLSDEEIAMAKNPILEEDWVDFMQYVRGVTKEEKEVAQAQWDSDIKWMEG